MALPPAVRLGIPDAGSLELDGDLATAAFDAALAMLPDFGGWMKPLDLTPFYAVASLLYEGAWVAEPTPS
jgi:allophanate hydrolase